MRECDGKIRHPSEELALLAMKSLRHDHKRKIKGAVLTVYRCWHCKYWHVGHRRKKWRKSDAT